MIGVNEEVLEPIPRNFIDMALNMVSKADEAANVKMQSESASSGNHVSADSENAHGGATVSTPLKSGADVRFFRDQIGNEYKVKDGVLFIKSWKKLNAKARIVKSANGREIPMDGKEIQVYGWSEVKNASDVDDIDDVDEDTEAK